MPLCTCGLRPATVTVARACSSEVLRRCGVCANQLVRAPLTLELVGRPPAPYSAEA